MADSLGWRLKFGVIAINTATCRSALRGNGSADKIEGFCSLLSRH